MNLQQAKNGGTKVAIRKLHFELPDTSGPKPRLSLACHNRMRRAGLDDFSFRF